MTDVTVIGCGFMGKHHARAIGEHTALTLESVVDVDEDRVDEVADACGAERALTDYGSAIEGADAAVVATPESYHAEQAHAALDAGVDLLLEKPVADDLDSAREISDRAADSALVTGISFVLRYDPSYAEACRLARNGDLGDLVAGRAMRGITVAESRRVGPRGHPNLYMSVHDIDAILAAVDESVKTVAANEHRGELSGIDVPDAVQAMLTFADGTTAVLEGYGVLPEDVPGGIVASFELTGTEGTASVETPGNTLEVVADGFDRPDTRHWPVVNGKMAGAVRRQIDRFADAIDGDAAMEATVSDGYEAQRVAEAVRQAAESGTVVSVDEVQ